MTNKSAFVNLQSKTKPSDAKTILRNFMRNPRQMLLFTNPIHIAECLYAIPRHLLEPKHVLAAGMLLRYSSGDDALVIGDRMLHVLSVDLPLQEFFKISRGKFYQDPFVIFAKNIEYLRKLDIHHDYTTLKNSLEIVLLQICGAYESFIEDLVRGSFSKDELTKFDLLALNASVNLLAKSGRIYSSSDANKAFVSNLEYCSMFLYAVGVADNYANLTRYVQQDASFAAKVGIKLITRNQVGHFTKYIDTNLCASKVMDLLIEILKLKTFANKDQLLLKMKSSFDENSKSIFGQHLAREVATYNDVAAATLELIYSLRLGLHDLTHLNNQIEYFVGKVYTITPSDLFYAKLNPEIKRQIACATNVSAVTRKVFIAHLANLRKNATQFVSKEKAHPLAVIAANQFDVTYKLKDILNDIIDEETSNRAIALLVYGVQKLEDQSGSLLFIEVRASLEYTGVDGWIFRDDNLAQGYIRFTYENPRQIVKHLLDSCKHTKYQTTHLSICTTQAVHTEHVRRTLTPSESMWDVKAIDGSPLIRSATVPNFRI